MSGFWVSYTCDGSVEKSISPTSNIWVVYEIALRRGYINIYIYKLQEQTGSAMDENWNGFGETGGANYPTARGQFWMGLLEG